MAKKSESIQLQELANASAKEIQKMINSANKLTMDFNASEAKKARDFNAQQVKLEQAFNSAEAQKARDWQTQMSNTAHQREVKDLKKAGLNPVLSVNSGAQSYTSASASAGAGSANNASGSFESGAGAMSSILGGLMSSITGLKQSQMSANAQLQSSKISAEASKYASDIARANAKTSAQAQIQSAKLGAEASKYASDTSYKTQMNKPSSSFWNFFDKYFSKASKKHLMRGDDHVKNARSVIHKTKWKGDTYNMSNYNPNKAELNNINSGLLKLGMNRGKLDSMSQSKQMKIRELYVDAFAYGNKKSLKKLKSYI